MNKEQPPIIHGRDHSPWGADPGRPGPWIFVGDVDGPPFQTGGNAPASAAIPNPVPLCFRIVLGAPNIVRGGVVTDYIWHQIEIQGDVTGVAPGDVVFTLPAEYRREFDVPVHSHDDSGVYVPCRLMATGEFIYGVP